MLDVKKLLAMMLTKLTTTVSAVTSSQTTLNGNANLNNYTFSIAKSGYTPIGIVGHSIEWVSGETAMCNIYRLQPSGNNVVVNVRNMGTNQVKFSIKVFVLYQKVWGGYFITSIISAIERWWEHVRRQKTSHKDNQQSASENNTDIHDPGIVSWSEGILDYSFREDLPNRGTRYGCISYIWKSIRANWLTVNTNQRKHINSQLVCELLCPNCDNWKHIQYHIPGLVRYNVNFGRRCLAC